MFKPRLLLWIALFVVIATCLFRCVSLLLARDIPADTLLVLGGTANRERYAAKLTMEHPERKVLISSGSQDPCIWLMFDKAGASKEKIWMEHCSRNTLENLIYSVPVLEGWSSKHVLLITDSPQADRAFPMAQIMLGAKGIWVDLVLVPDSGGEPARHSVWIEIAMSALCACVTQVYEPHCSDVTHLSEIDMKAWSKKGYYCQQQAEVSDYKPLLK